MCVCVMYACLCCQRLHKRLWSLTAKKRVCSFSERVGVSEVVSSSLKWSQIECVNSFCELLWDFLYTLECNSVVIGPLNPVVL